jgi:outer membrane protein TolC
MWWLVSTAAAMELSYDEALKRALEKNPALVVAQYDLESAEGQLVGSNGLFDPVLFGNIEYHRQLTEEFDEDVQQTYVLTDRPLTFDLGVEQYFPTGTTASVSWGAGHYHLIYDYRGEPKLSSTYDFYGSSFTGRIRQSLLRGNWISYNLSSIQQAREYRDAREASLAEQRQQTLADTATAYWNVYYQTKVAEIAQGAVQVAVEEQRVVRARVEAGDLAPVERSRVDALVVQAEASLLSAQNAAQSAGDELLLVIGEAPGQDLTLTTEPADPPAIELDEQGVVAEALASSPTVQVGRINEHAAHLALREASYGRLPQLDAEAQYTIGGTDITVGEDPEDKATLGDATANALASDLPYWSIGATLTVPLGNRTARGAFLDTRALAARATTEREALERGVDQAVRAQVRTLESARKSVSLAEANLAFAEETLAAERALQNAGRAIQRDVLEAIRDVDDARVALAKARADAALALVELNRLRGSL